MKIVISPAKSLEMERDFPAMELTQPRFLKQAERLNKLLAKKSPRSLCKLMSISSDLAELNWQRNQDFDLPFTEENARPAIYTFDGDVYQGLDAFSLKPEALERMQDDLRILSGLYGMLRPFDLMQAYRLEMGTSLKIGRKKNLYEFWKQDLTKALNEEMEDGELLVNLASQEYFSALDAKKLKAQLIAPVFKDWNNDKLRVISFFAKKARGAMVRFILEKGAENPQDLLEFNYEGYQFSKEHTVKENAPVFIR